MQIWLVGWFVFRGRCGCRKAYRLSGSRERLSSSSSSYHQPSHMRTIRKRAFCSWGSSQNTKPDDSPHHVTTPNHGFPDQRARELGTRCCPRIIKLGHLHLKGQLYTDICENTRLVRHSTATTRCYQRAIGGDQQGLEDPHSWLEFHVTVFRPWLSATIPSKLQTFIRGSPAAVSVSNHGSGRHICH